MAGGGDLAALQQVNSRWLEALDSSSGRVYYIDRQTLETAWEPPDLFMDRAQLAAAYCEVLARLDAPKVEGEGDDEASFLAKVRARFPPPAGPPPRRLPPSRHRSAPDPKAWRRGLSVVGEEPPPPPAWALSLSKSQKERARPSLMQNAMNAQL
mmetsp:Transcript_14131/g.35235  ORF Transcript_14131/g.35235 Transcript_14131/m.35235 type:complete len:154 (-) Transcript_14131:268-729(-)